MIITIIFVHLSSFRQQLRIWISMGTFWRVSRQLSLILLFNIYINHLRISRMENFAQSAVKLIFVIWYTAPSHFICAIIFLSVAKFTKVVSLTFPAGFSGSVSSSILFSTGISSVYSFFATFYFGSLFKGWILFWICC